MAVMEESSSLPSENRMSLNTARQWRLEYTVVAIMLTQSKERVRNCPCNHTNPSIPYHPNFHLKLSVLHSNDL